MVLCLLLFLGCLALFGANNTFPVRYHPDEPGKVSQIRSGEYNFKHPQLMLSATRLLLSAQGADRDQRTVLLAGRWTSAFFGTLAVLALTLLAYASGGLGAALCVGPLLMLCHALLVYSHFMKEDAALCGAFALWLLAVAFFLQKPAQRGRAALLGLCCGLFISGKYIGVTGLPISLALALLLPAKGRWRGNIVRAAMVLVCCLGGYLLANFQILLDPATFWKGLSYESKHAFSAHFGSYLKVPNWHGVRGLWEEVPLVVWLPAAFYAQRVIRQWRERSPQERFMLFAPLVILVPLVFSRLYSTRYILPATVALYWLAGMGLWELIARPPKWRRRGFVLAGWLLLVAALGYQGYMSGKLVYLFAHDARAELERFAATALSEDAVLLQDKYAALPDTPEEKAPTGFALQVVTERFAGSLGDLETARERGISHVAVCNRSYDRFFVGRAVLAEYEDTYRSMRHFYQELFQEGRLLWQCKRRPGFPYMNIELRLYDISPHSADSEDGGETVYCPEDVSRND